MTLAALHAKQKMVKLLFKLWWISYPAVYITDTGVYSNTNS